MAITARTTYWEFRPAGGSNTNGGFYNTAAGTTDYSQQDTAQASFTNLSTDVAGTRITDDDTGNNFTAQMVGNGMYISGTSAGWYQITNYVDANNVDVDRSAGGSQSGLSGAVGGAVALYTDTLLEFIATSRSSRIYHKNDGTMTLTGNIDLAQDGFNQYPCQIIGYKDTRGDAPSEANRPLVACAANTFKLSDWWHLYNLRFTGTSTNVVEVQDEAIVENCSFVNSSGTANRIGILFSRNVGPYSASASRCYSESTNGYAYGLDSRTRLDRCVAKDSVIGLQQLESPDIIVVNCIIDTCATGINESGGRYGSMIEHCTVYNSSTVGIKLAGGRRFTVKNCIIDSCGTGIEGNTIIGDTSLLDYNNLYNNTTDYDGVSAGPNDTALDPQFVDAANGDFNVGTNMNTTVDFPGAETEDTYNKGAVQSISSISAAGEVAYGSVG